MLVRMVLWIFQSQVQRQRLAYKYRKIDNLWSPAFLVSICLWTSTKRTDFLKLKKATFNYYAFPLGPLCIFTPIFWPRIFSSLRLFQENHRSQFLFFLFVSFAYFYKGYCLYKMIAMDLSLWRAGPQTPSQMSTSHLYSVQYQYTGNHFHTGLMFYFSLNFRFYAVYCLI